jgi:HK97 gp10 family phage protein
MNITIDTKNFDKFQGILKDLLKETNDKCEKMIERTAIKIESKAKYYCPVDTGRLRSSISHRLSYDRLGAEIGTNVDYAEFVEFGTSKMDAQPYLRPAFIEVVANIVEDYKK